MNPTTRRLRTALAAVALGTAGVAYAPASEAADNATVTVSATAAAPCITIKQPSVSFGTNLTFSRPGNNATKVLSIQNGVVLPNVTSCAGSSQDVLARTTDFTGTGATWSPKPLAQSALQQCDASVGLNKFTLELIRQVNGNFASSTLLQTTNQTYLSQLGAGVDDTSAGAWTLTTPCQGSDGAGTAMSASVIFTAVLG